MSEGTSLIDDSTSHSTNPTYGTPLLVIEGITSSHFQVTPSWGDASQICSELSPPSAKSPPCLLLHPSIENFGEKKHAVPKSPILQQGISISGYSSTRHSAPMYLESSSINIMSDGELTNDGELDFCIGHEIIYDNFSLEDNLYGDFTTNADSPSSTSGSKVFTSPHNQTSAHSTHRENSLVTTEDVRIHQISLPYIQRLRSQPLLLKSSLDPK